MDHDQLQLTAGCHNCQDSSLEQRGGSDIGNLTTVSHAVLLLVLLLVESILVHTIDERQLEDLAALAFHLESSCLECAALSIPG